MSNEKIEKSASGFRLRENCPWLGSQELGERVRRASRFLNDRNKAVFQRLQDASSKA
jgi:hypothetical protein